MLTGHILTVSCGCTFPGACLVSWSIWIPCLMFSWTTSEYCDFNLLNFVSNSSYLILYLSLARRRDCDVVRTTRISSDELGCGVAETDWGNTFGVASPSSVSGWFCAGVAAPGLFEIYFLMGEEADLELFFDVVLRTLFMVAVINNKKYENLNFVWIKLFHKWNYCISICFCFFLCFQNLQLVFSFVKLTMDTISIFPNEYAQMTNIT